MVGKERPVGSPRTSNRPSSRPQTPTMKKSATARPNSLHLSAMNYDTPSPRPKSASSSPSKPRPQSAIDFYPDSPVAGAVAPNGGNVKVVVRVRPFLERELQKNATSLIQMDPDDDSTTIYPPVTMANTKRNNDPRQFYFDHSFWSLNPEDENFATQQTVYDSIGKEFLDHNMEGYHTCIFAYGQTGSGKSYTMMGDQRSPGLIPRTCQDLFQRIDGLITSNVSCTVRISYFEVYNEQVRDLLSPNKKEGAKLRVRESPTDGPYVEDLSEYAVKDLNQVMKYINEGNKARVTAATKMNTESSRSHAVFTLVVKQVHFDPDSDTTEEKLSRIRLVDLAGSERANSSGATGARLREGSNINKSLTTLGRVIASLAATSSVSGNNKQLVPYRDSVLTWLLKDSIGGNSKTAMVACISPTDYEETLSTLRYADQAKRIKTKAVINQDIVSGADRDKLVEEMQERINSLQNSLTQYTSHQREEDQFKAELEKVKHAIRFYEERAITEENKRKAIQAESNAVSRHNRLLTEHLKEVTNKNVGTFPLPDSSSSIITNNYDNLKEEMDTLLSDIGEFRQQLSSVRQSYRSKLISLDIACT
jgi:hypothetical protein